MTKKITILDTAPKIDIYIDDTISGDDITAVVVNDIKIKKQIDILIDTEEIIKDVYEFTELLTHLVYNFREYRWYIVTFYDRDGELKLFKSLRKHIDYFALGEEFSNLIEGDDSQLEEYQMLSFSVLMCTLVDSKMSCLAYDLLCMFENKNLYKYLKNKSLLYTILKQQQRKDKGNNINIDLIYTKILKGSGDEQRDDDIIHIKY